LIGATFASLLSNFNEELLMRFNRFATVATLASTLIAATFAANMSANAAAKKKMMQPAASNVVHVSLTGEADNPMGIKIDVAQAKAGTFEFDVTNDAIGTDHEVVLVKLKASTQKIAVDPSKDRIDEGKLKSMGEVAALKPGATGKLNVKLAAGDYLLLCNHKSHYKMGMYTPFTVTN
jgi:uncharacterized cupredoxin-like copper-binding protein